MSDYRVIELREQRDVARARIVELERAIRDYLAEYGTPVPDYALRKQYRERLAKLVDR